jgi:hypothetical protein
MYYKTCIFYMFVWLLKQVAHKNRSQNMDLYCVSLRMHKGLLLLVGPNQISEMHNFEIQPLDKIPQMCHALKQV